MLYVGKKGFIISNNLILHRVLPEQVNIPSKAVINFIDSIYEKQINLHSFMILRKGKVASEGYFKPFNDKLKHNIFSVSKSVTSAAIGLAIGEGLITLEDKVIDFFPEKLEGEIHKFTAMMKIKHLLAMATVHPRSTDTSIEDWVKGFLNTPPSHMPGTTFAYDTTGTHTLCAIIQKVTGITVHEYLRTRLFDAVGIGEIEWESCSFGINKGGSGIKCTTEDLARFGQLYLQKGQWNETQVLPKGWVELSTSTHIDNSNARMLLDVQLGYGYQFWRTRHDSYCAFGMGGQLVLVLPDKETVFVCTANTLLYKDGQQLIMESFWQNIYPALFDETVEEDLASYNELKKRLQSLSLVLPKGENESKTAKKVNRKKFNFEGNALGYQSCEFIFEGDDSKLRFIKDGTVTELNFGINKWIEGTDPFMNFKSASAATWVDEKTCILHTQIFDELQMFILTCSFEEEYLVIQLQPVGVLKTEKFEIYLNGSMQE